MLRRIRYWMQWGIAALIATVTLFAALLPVLPAQAAPFGEPTATTVELFATQDARIQAGSPDNGFGSGFIWVGTPNGHLAFVQFDLMALPVNATINSAELQLNFTGTYTPTANVELGRNESAWDENTVTWNTKPTSTFGGPIQPVGATAGVISWNVTPLVAQWQANPAANYGFALRGDGPLKSFFSTETDVNKVPKLVITYTVPPDEGPRPDLGDAPDSSNHHGQNNTAYAIGGVLGQFPTVRDVPAGQAAGPRHDNQSMEGWLGNFLSREAEADLGPDQDGPNNILRNAAGVIGDVADNDRGDDGWRNRTIKFFDCQRQTLDVRISKAPTATRNTMYLNVWFDGNRDGDWADLGQCQPNQDEPAQASYEWIVQNYIIDMTAIPAGGALDFAINTEKVFNNTPAMPHWMRFTLSEEPAVQPGGGQLPDGRGPHPTGVLGSYKFGETEDIFQKPAPAGEDGTLELVKRVITDGEPVEWIDYVTYQILLRHNGGTQPVQAKIRDLLPYPLIVYPTIDASGVAYVVVESATGGAVPLQAQLDVIPSDGVTPPQQVVKWQGTLAPNAEVKLTFQVRVIALCAPNQQTLDFTNTAQARPAVGDPISAADTFTAKCVGYDENNIDFEADPILNEIDLDDLTHYPWQGTIHNLHPVSVTLGIYQQPITGTVAASTLIERELLDQITLGPNETKSIDIALRMADESHELLAGDDDLAGTLSFCFMPGENAGCPNEQQYPQLHGHIPFTLTVRPNDLGDAPDSSNHTVGANMAAYPIAGVQANFPTVFDPATGLPEGPRHSFPRPFHLGQRVSREAEADGGPDQDPLNNIIPAANDPDNDRFDDGTNLALWNLNDCQTTNLPVQVAITPQAVNYFQQLGTPGYINIWLDSNRDGDWADATQCGAQPAVEHIVIDSPVNVVGLGAGLHVINVPTGRVPWQVTDKPAWVRITLSERPSNKTLTAGGLNYGDGRGYPQSFKVGETEDYFYRPLAADNGPDLAVYLAGEIKPGSSQDLGLQAAALAKLGNFEIQLFKIDYENLGSVPAQNALLEFQIPEKLRDLEIILVKGTDVTKEDISFNFDKLSFILPHIEQNARGSLVLGWYGCITCTVTAATSAVDHTASVNVTLDGDIDTSNNQSTATLRGLLSSPIIGAFMDYTDDSCMDRIVTGRAVTNQSTVQLRGQAEPNSIIAILIGLVQVGTANSDANGGFSYTVNLGQGVYDISARYADAAIVSPRDSASGLPTGKIKLLVNSSLPFDPISTCFVDSKSRSYSLPTLGYSFGATQTGSWLRSGETYRVSVNASRGNLNQYFKVIFEDIVLSSLTDEDGNGTYQGLVVMPDPGVMQAASVAATAKFGFLVGDGSTESSFSTEVTTGADGIISDRSTGQPLANANVAALVGQATSNGSVFFSGWAASQSGQANPQTTGADGKYSYSASTGIYQLDVVRDGYQPYRSQVIDAGEESLNQAIALSPVVAEVATQIIYIDENGFTPSVVNVAPGAVIEWINVGLDEHRVTGNGWESGVLTVGASYKAKVTSKGTFTYGDGEAAGNQATIIVGDGVVGGEQRIFLPLVSR